MPIQLIDSAEVARMLGVIPATVLRQSRTGSLPGPVYGEQRIHLWDRQTIQEWVAAGRPRDVAVWLASRKGVQQ